MILFIFKFFKVKKIYIHYDKKVALFKFIFYSFCYYYIRLVFLLKLEFNFISVLFEEISEIYSKLEGDDDSS